MTEKKIYYIKQNIFYKLLDKGINNINEYIEDFVYDEEITVDGKNIRLRDAIESLEIHFREINDNAVEVIINFNDKVSEDSRKHILDALNNYLYDQIENLLENPVVGEEIKQYKNLLVNKINRHVKKSKKRSGVKRSGVKRSGVKRSGKKRSGKKRSGVKRSGKKRSGKKRSGVKRSGKKRSGKKRSGKKRSGVKRSGKKRSGVKKSKKRSGVN